MMHIQQLVIVRRNQFATFACLAQAFADEPNVRLVWDRRFRERRLQSETPSSEDQRGGDRRRGLSRGWGTNDYLLLTSREHPAPVAPPAYAGGARSEPPAADPGRLIRDMGLDIDAAVRSDVAVLISGGDAISRQSLAQRIHRGGDRGTRPFVIVDRKAFARLIEIDTRDPSRASEITGGTLLIEDIGQWSLQQQSDLMVFIERRSPPQAPQSVPEARLMSGTDHWLFDRVASRKFRADLFYRLNAIHLVLPAGTARAFQ